MRRSNLAKLLHERLRVLRICIRPRSSTGIASTFGGRERTVAAEGDGFERFSLLTGERTSRRVSTTFSNACRWRPGSSCRRDRGLSHDYPRVCPPTNTCSGVTLYQETYDPPVRPVHRWGPEEGLFRSAGSAARRHGSGDENVGSEFPRPVGSGLRLRLPPGHAAPSAADSLEVGITLSFPRLRPQAGISRGPFPLTEAWLARLVFAIRIVRPDVPLCSRRGNGRNSGTAWRRLGISKMKARKPYDRGGYAGRSPTTDGQFQSATKRSVPEICAMLRNRG